MSNNNVKEEKKYRHLSPAEREEIAIGLSKGLKKSEIAQMPNRSPSVISREIEICLRHIWFRMGQTERN
jgi:IS30 family transposase